MNNKPAKLIFTGDIGFDRYMDGTWADEHLLSDDILDFFASADYRIANVEGAVADPDKVEHTKGFFFHVMNPKAVEFTRRINTTYWNINNNHIMDGGLAGIKSTMQIAEDEGVVTYGAGVDLEEASKPLYIDAAGGIGLISLGYDPECVPASENAPGCFPWSNLELIQKRINEIKGKCRWCIITVHTGDEFCNLPLPGVRERYLKYLEMGADIVVGSHPHCPQNYETVGDKIVFYSLGNFIFDTDYQRAQFNTEIGMLLRLELTDKDYSFTPMAVKLDRSTKRLAQTEIPAIFTDVPAAEYDKLIPLSAKARVKAERVRRCVMNPKVYGGYTDADWADFFANFKDDGYICGMIGDMQYMQEWASKAENGEWKDGMPAVKAYIEEQL